MPSVAMITAHRIADDRSYSGYMVIAICDTHCSYIIYIPVTVMGNREQLVFHVK